MNSKPTRFTYPGKAYSANTNNEATTATIGIVETNMIPIYERVVRAVFMSFWIFRSLVMSDVVR